VLAELRAATGRGDLIVLSLDADVVDPAELPAVDHRLKGGLSMAELVQLAAPVARLACSVDVAELNPLRDTGTEGCRRALQRHLHAASAMRTNA